MRLEAIIAVDSFSGRLGPEQEAVVDSLARLLLHDDDIAVRNEAMIRTASQVDEVLTKARQATLESRLSEAESIYADALVIDPTSQRAHYQLGVSSTKTRTPSAGSTRYEHTVYCWMCLCYLTNHTWMGDSTTRPGAMRPGPMGLTSFPLDIQRPPPPSTDLTFSLAGLPSRCGSVSTEKMLNLRIWWPRLHSRNRRTPTSTKVVL